MIAVCSAFKEAFIAVDLDGKKDFSMVDANCGHSEKLLPEIAKLLDKNGLSIKDNDKFAVVVGPGSFTGLRIGIALVKGLCAGLEKEAKVYPITSFELMAYTYIKHNKPRHDFICVINALSGKVFKCQFDLNGNKKGEEELVLAGEVLNQSNIVGLEEENICKELIKISSEDLLELALIKSKGKKALKASEIVPLYLRKSQAEDDLERKRKKS